MLKKYEKKTEIGLTFEEIEKVKDIMIDFYKKESEKYFTFEFTQGYFHGIDIFFSILEDRLNIKKERVSDERKYN